jgi:hypothetical protein
LQATRGLASRIGDRLDQVAAGHGHGQPHAPVDILKHVIGGLPEPPGTAPEFRRRDRLPGEPHHRRGVGLLAQVCREPLRFEIAAVQQVHLIIGEHRLPSRR